MAIWFRNKNYVYFVVIEADLAFIYSFVLARSIMFRFFAVVKVKLEERNSFNFISIYSISPLYAIVKN